jgi:hypothetical protein
MEENVERNCHICGALVPQHHHDCRVWDDLARFRRVYDRLGKQQRGTLGVRLLHYLTMHANQRAAAPGMART